MGSEKKVLKFNLRDIVEKKEPWGYRKNVISTELTGSKGVFFGLAVFLPQQSLGVHWHEDEEETLYIRKGHGIIGAESEGDMRVEPQTVLYIPPNEKHWVKNPTDEEFWMVSVRSPVK